MGLEQWGLPSPNYDMTHASGVLTLLISMLLVGVATWLAAKAVLRKDDFYKAMAAGMIGLVCAHLAYILTDKYDIVALLLGLAAFSLVTAAVYRAKPAQGFVVGAVAWVLWILATIALTYVKAHWVAN
ncbi:MAG: hypothetical protein V4510_11875 [bacterium]